MDSADPELLDRLDAYFDAVPRDRSDPVEVGPFVLFHSREPHPFYARPRRDRVGAATSTITPEQVRELSAKCHELGIPLQVEWLVDWAPDVGPACVEADLEIVEYPLLTVTADAFEPVEPPHGTTVELLTAHTDPADLPAVLAVADVGFRAGPGDTAVGADGPAERDELVAAMAPRQLEAAQRNVNNGSIVRALVRDGAGGVVATGSVSPVGDTAEIMGVATLPAFRRQGFAAAVTSVLVAAAFDRGCDLVLLSAGSDDVARVYERLGFARVGHTGAAEPGPGEQHQRLPGPHPVRR